MNATLTRDALYEGLLKDCVREGLTESDALLWMVLLHTHEIRLRPGSVGANGSALVLSAITQRHAAEVVARLWAMRNGDQGQPAQSAYWYGRYNRETPFEILDDVPDVLRARLTELRDVLSHDSRVEAITPEE
jgi:hypothetical protein